MEHDPSPHMIIEGFRPRSLIERSIIDSAGMYNLIHLILEHMKQELPYISDRKTTVLDKLDELMKWGRNRKDVFMPFICFWWLYSGYKGVRVMVRDLELKYYPFQWKKEQLRLLKRYVNNILNEHKTEEFDSSNIRAKIMSIHKLFLHTIHVQDMRLIEEKSRPRVEKLKKVSQMTDEEKLKSRDPYLIESCINQRLHRSNNQTK